MSKLNSVELKDSINQMVLECRSIVDKCKTEKREMDEEEKKRFDELKEDIEDKKRELNELEEELKNYDEELPEGVKDDEEDKEEKNKRNHRSMKKTLVKELRNALENNIKTIKVNAETRAVSVNGEGEGASAIAGVHDNVVETELQGILEPLYAKSVLTQLGVTWYKGLPQGDISIPIMGKGTVGWADEMAAAGASGNTFSNKVLQPKRLTAYVDISKQLIAQDSLGAEEAIRRDIVNALQDKLEATILGSEASTTNKPAGIFYGATLSTNNTYAKVAEAEAQVETNNVFGEMKYLMAPTTKAFYRTLAKGQNNSGFVYENGEMDGTPTLVTSNIASNKYVYGNFANLAVGSWGDVEITLDPYTTAINGTVRLVINAYFDAKILRPEAFVFGKTQA